MPYLRCQKPHVVFQECPNHVALCFSFYGCPLKCSGCHSEELWNKAGGSPLSHELFEDYLNQYQGLITAVVFFGGEWRPNDLQQKLKIARQHKLKTCLYSGLNNLSRHLKPHLDFAKLGPWVEELGGLEQHTSNQKFYALKDGEIHQDLTGLFHSSHAAPISITAPVKSKQITEQLPLFKLDMVLVPPSTETTHSTNSTTTNSANPTHNNKRNPNHVAA